MRRPTRRLPQAVQLRLRRFEMAVRAHELRGVETDEDEIDEINAELKTARRSLVEAIIALVPTRSMVPRAVEDLL